ncbi:hypothetical protein LOS10_16020, partial [Proteus mirabilis]|uniref:hypothetical protein n=1 Tax=Proteus mirabilis TaxID=584 RepID=UPI001E36C79E
MELLESAVEALKEGREPSLEDLTNQQGRNNIFFHISLFIQHIELQHGDKRVKSAYNKKIVK